LAAFSSPDTKVKVGSVGTGFKTKDAEYLRALSTSARPRAGGTAQGQEPVFAEPTLVAEIEFRG
jgi:bifunctional non-homologous end joining protein LigD